MFTIKCRPECSISKQQYFNTYFWYALVWLYCTSESVYEWASHIVQGYESVPIGLSCSLAVSFILIPVGCGFYMIYGLKAKGPSSKGHHRNENKYFDIKIYNSFSSYSTYSRRLSGYCIMWSVLMPSYRFFKLKWMHRKQTWILP